MTMVVFPEPGKPWTNTSGELNEVALLLSYGEQRAPTKMELLSPRNKNHV
jgi:hypothetical protein